MRKPKSHKRTSSRAFADPETYAKSVYYQRNRILLKMGFASYRAYLASDLWKRIRLSFLKENPSCFCCGKPATQVHHTVYLRPVLAGERTNGLISVCGGCHRKSEFRVRDNKKLNPKQATAKLKFMKTTGQG